MTNQDVGLYSNTTLSDEETQLYKSAGTTVSAINNVNIVDIAEAMVSGKVDDQQPNLWLIGNSTRNLTNFARFISSQT